MNTRLEKVVKVLSLIVLTIMALSMIGAGWYSEVLFYYYRLIEGGLDYIPSISIGAGLTLSLAYFFMRREWWSNVIAVVLLGMSVFFTMAGQNYFYTEKHNSDNKITAVEENKQKLYNEYTDNINQLKIKINVKENIIPTDLEELANWKTNAINPLRDDIAILKKEKVYYEKERKDIVLVNSDSVKIESLTAYEALANDLGLSSFTPLKLISQALLSLFIALMAPSGIELLKRIWNVKPQEVAKKTKKDVPDTVDKISLFTNSLYRFEENPPTLKSRTEVAEETGLSYGYFGTARKIALNLGLIRKLANNVTIPIATKTEFISHMKTRQPYSSSIRAVR